MAIRAGVAHILFRSRHQPFTPEDRPIVIESDLSSEITFTFIDIIPGVPRPHEFHGFSSLVEEANVWLAEHANWDVMNCETVLLFFKGSENEQHLAPEDTCFPLDGESHQYLMGLRVWILKSGEQQSTPHCLKYVDFTPRKDEDNPNSRFRKLDAVLERVNNEIQSGACDRHMGEIVTIETLYYPVTTSDWTVDQKTAVNLFPSRTVCLVRIFYLHSQEQLFSFPVIGVKDFVPKQVSGGGFFKMPVFEDFSRVLERASEWISSNPELRFKNAQCLEVKMKKMGRIDTKTMSHSAGQGDFVRFFRVAFIRTDSQSLSPPPAPIFLSSVIFTPADRDASVQEIKHKIHEWVQNGIEAAESLPNGMPHVRLLSAETVELFCKDFSVEELSSETEDTFKPNRIGTRNQFLFMALRVYFDVGFFAKGVERRVSQTLLIPSKYRKHGHSCKLM